MTLSNQTYTYPTHSELIQDQISNQFYLPLAVTKTHLANYYILHWQGSHISYQMLESPLIYNKVSITREGVTYLIKYDEGLSEAYLLLHGGEQYKLSFRRAKNDLYGTVLIRKIGN